MGIYVFIILQSTWGNLENYMMWRDRMYKLESQNDVKNYQVDICVFDKMSTGNLYDSVILDALHEP